MRLTVFLLGAGLFGFGWFVGHFDTVTSVANPYGGYEESCGTPFNPRPIPSYAPDLARACTTVLQPGRYLAIAGLVIGGLLLIRLLYMLIGPKIPGPGTQPHTEGPAST